MKKALIDSSFLVALINQKDSHHVACVQVAQNDMLDKRIPITAIPETCYLLHKWLGHHVMRSFVDILRDPIWEIEQVMQGDFVRVEELLRQYADARLDFVDATVVAIAERVDIDTILTLDRRDFYMIRPLHTDHFTILP
jgi:predicted nucleic acid-binding protein